VKTCIWPPRAAAQIYTELTSQKVGARFVSFAMRNWARIHDITYKRRATHSHVG